MSKLTVPEIYVEDVLSGKLIVGKLIALAVQRHVDDLNNAHLRSLYFSKTAALHALSFFKFIKHSKGEWAGKEFDLAPWQQFILWVLFGWFNKDGSRRYRYAYIEVARKNGKTTLAAGIGNYLFIADGEPGAEVYSSATSRNQAKICFNEARNMVRASPALKSRVTVYQHNMHIIANASKFEPISSDTRKQEGLNPHGAIIDEYHVHKSTEMYDVIKSALGARRSPLILIITTAGFEKESPCYRLRKTCIDILSGIKHQDNMFAAIFTLDEDDDWQNEKLWKKSNPNLGISVGLKYLQEEYQSAMNNRGTEEVNFKTKNLNIWTDAAKVWIPDDIWMKGALEINEKKLIGRECYMGLDLSEKYDIEALVLLFPPTGDDDKFTILPYFWIPAEKVKNKEEAVDYLLWEQQGFVNIVSGNVVDDDLVKELIIACAEKYDVRMLGYDDWNSKKFITDLGKAGFPIEEKSSKVSQYMSTLSSPTKELYNMVVDGKLNHGGNPILRWMIGNVVLRYDTNNNYRIDKSKSSERVDGVSATINAICEWMTPPEEDAINRIYANRGLDSV